MKILQVTALVAGGVGGHVRMVARGLTDAGHQVVVACPAAVADRFDLATTGASIAALEVGSRARPDRDLQTVQALRRLAAGADVVHAHGMRAGALAALALRGKATRLVVTAHNAAPGGLAGLVYRALERIVCARADLVLGVSPDLVERARQCGAHGTGTAVVPADLSAVPRGPDAGRARERIRGELGLTADQLVVLSVGRLGSQKRMGAVVEAVDGLISSADGLGDAVVLIAGDGPDHGDLLDQAEATRADVRLLGHRRDIPELLAAADVVVSAARWEGQPLWLQEALGAGAAIIATDVGGTSLVVQDAAVLIPGEERGLVPALRGALGLLLTDPEERERLRALARTRAESLPSEHAALEAAETAYRGGRSDPDADGEPGAHPVRGVN